MLFYSILRQNDSVDTFLEVEILKENRSSAGIVKLYKKIKYVQQWLVLALILKMKGFNGLETSLQHI